MLQKEEGGGEGADGSEGLEFVGLGRIFMLALYVTWLQPKEIEKKKLFIVLLYSTSDAATGYVEQEKWKLELSILEKQ